MKKFAPASIIFVFLPKANYCNILQLTDTYHNNNKYGDTSESRVNNVDPDQTAPRRSSLIRLCNVYYAQQQCLSQNKDVKILGWLWCPNI